MNAVAVMKFSAAALSQTMMIVVGRSPAVGESMQQWWSTLELSTISPGSAQRNGVAASTDKNVTRCERCWCRGIGLTKLIPFSI